MEMIRSSIQYRIRNISGQIRSAESRFNIQMTEFRKSISMEWIIRMVHPQNV
jgi:hypothetical protein